MDLSFILNKPIVKKSKKNMLNCTSILKTHNLFGKLINSNDEYNGTIVAILGTEQGKILVRTLEKEKP